MTHAFFSVSIPAVAVAHRRPPRDAGRIAREQHGRKTEAVASVIIDRMMGLYALFLMVAVAFMLSDLSQPEVMRVCQVNVVLAIVGKKQVALARPLPETVQTLKEDAQWVKAQKS